MRRVFCLILRSSEGGLDTLLELMNALRISKDALNVKGAGTSSMMVQTCGLFSESCIW